MQNPTILTYRTKTEVNLVNPDPETIFIEDIACALAKQCRFTGHVPEFYSVAQHSTNCAQRFKDPELQLCALLHDASEAYLGDVSRPLKQLLPEYKKLEEKFEKAISKRFGLPYPFDPAIKKVDIQVFEKEDRWRKDPLHFQSSFENPSEILPTMDERFAERIFLRYLKTVMISLSINTEPPYRRDALQRVSNKKNKTTKK